MLKTPLGRLRLAGFLEGASFLALLGIAMPLKYLAGEPTPVLVVGWIHGLLFILYVVAIARAKIALSWSPVRTAGALAASVLPFGPFVFDIWLRRDQRQAAASGSVDRT